MPPVAAHRFPFPEPVMPNRFQPYQPTRIDLEQLAAEGYNRVPVTRRVLGDYDTPLSVYHKLVEGPFGYLFESVTGGERWGRYSIIGLPSPTVLTVHGHRVVV